MAETVVRELWDVTGEDGRDGWDACERCCGRVRDVYAPGAIAAGWYAVTRCEDCGLVTRVADNP
jgi:hypothetical protein